VEQEYTANAAQRGEQLRQGLVKLQRQHRFISDVRGLGLMQAIELVQENAPESPDPALRDQIVQTAFQNGLLLLGCGESAVRFCPPLCITAAQVDSALTILSRVLAGLRKSEKLAV
jgi:4-aminobutyrate aminotransferase